MTMNIYVKDYLLLSLLMNFRWCNNKRMNWIEFFLWYLYLQAYTHTHTHTVTAAKTHTNIQIYLYTYISCRKLLPFVPRSFARSFARWLMIDDRGLPITILPIILPIYIPHTLYKISMSWVMICYVVQAAFERFIGVLLSTHFRFDTCVQYIYIYTLYI